MTDKLKEKAQQALGALEAAGYGGSYAAIELREALDEQAEKEPVGYVYMKDFLNIRVKDVALTKDVPVGTGLYAAPVRTKDLTDDEISTMGCAIYGDTSVPEVTQIRIDFARAVIAADREKNK